MKDEIHVMRTDMKNELHTVHEEIKSQGNWNIGFIIGIYGMIGAAALGKIFGVL